MEDTKILELFFARDEEAIKQTDMTYGRRLFVLADNIVQSREDAEESVNDTYLKAWDTIPPQKPIHFFAYLAKICRHFALDRLDWRKAAKRNAEVVSLTQEMESCIPDKGRDAMMEGQELGLILNDFLRTLTPDTQIQVVMRDGSQVTFTGCGSSPYSEPMSSLAPQSPIDLTQTSYVLLPDGTKLEVPQ